jgi:undecaprenyl phosphate N,N'-diacetylbacillosamine 1-phosphate transferase
MNIKLNLYLFIKRSCDIILSLMYLILSSPIFLICSILIKFDSHGPIFVKSKRIGENGKPFNLIKFRTVDIYSSQKTKVGYMIEKMRLNEMPQLINILKGEMSFIGPRPAYPWEVSHYKDWEKERLNCKPGITGLAQIFINEMISFE